MNNDFYNGTDGISQFGSSNISVNPAFVTAFAKLGALSPSSRNSTVPTWNVTNFVPTASSVLSGATAQTISPTDVYFNTFSGAIGAVQ